ncbi:nicotinate (nicotinamide) nucleotide adenylyltransferase [Acidobacteria bacterium AB60]|nr:nicotinate (nicotinamide) nucleotide adenylyltransferase [Acidobacteria bacterium AB60]
MASRPRVAFFGGSFDPPHLGHLAIARAARAALCLDTVLFAPVGAQPLKPLGSTAPFADRAEMTRLAIAGEPGFELSLLDAPTPEGRPNYTLDTLSRLRSQLGPHAALFCLMGADSFLSLRQWRGAAEIPFAATLIVASRPGQPLDDLAQRLGHGFSLEPTGLPPACLPSDMAVRSYTLRDPAGRTAPFHLLPDLDVEISASAIRAQAHAAASDHDPPLVPPAVSAYIRAHRLYQ